MKIRRLFTNYFKEFHCLRTVEPRPIRGQFGYQNGISVVGSPLMNQIIEGCAAGLIARNTVRIFEPADAWKIALLHGSIDLPLVH